VIKILLLFSHAFWKDRQSADGKSLKEIGWLFSGETIPTWWTQAPDGSALLTGWLAGPKAQAFKDADDSTILQVAIESLGQIFTMKPFELAAMLAHSKVVNWVADPFSLGAYSYATPETREAARQASIPVDNTIFFAGEALYDGPEIGTVEAALANGLRVAKVVLEGF
jgi:monoamine oxidase